MSDDVWQWLTGIVIIAIVFMLVRPGSPAGKAVNDFGNALSAMVKAATGWHYTGPGSNTAGGSGGTLSA